ncbi:methyltransferase [Amycolatopsis sp. NPDC049688]|uniref:methyltransferase n=1 Tax=Amycolatopsis sp. NPDC049688 TaxID=3154733 RepID=UPI003441C5FC
MAQDVAQEPVADEVRGLFELMYGTCKAQVVRAFVLLDLAGALAGGPLRPDELVVRLNSHAGATASFVRACAALGLVRLEPDGRIAVTSLGGKLGTGAPAAAHVRYLLGPGVTRAYEHMKDVVLRGRSGGEVHGQHLFDYLGDHPDEGSAYENVMSEFTADCLAGLLTAHDFSGYRRMVDVGGGKGDLLCHVLSAAPQATGTLYDLPHVIELARDAVAAGVPDDVASRLEFAPGNFLESVPGGADLYLLKSVLIDWSDEHVARILATIHRTAPEGSTLLVIDWFGPDTAEEVAADPSMALRDFFVRTIVGGRYRSRREFEAALTNAGFTVERVISAFATGPSHWGLLVARR